MHINITIFPLACKELAPDQKVHGMKVIKLTNVLFTSCMHEAQILSKRMKGICNENK